MGLYKEVYQLLYTDPKSGNHVYKNEEINFYAKQSRTSLKNCGEINAECIDEAIAKGGYRALAKVLEQNNPDAVIEEIEKSGLRGRGGGGFSASRERGFSAAKKRGKAFVVCYWGEGDPGGVFGRGGMGGGPHKIL